jgi:hypothetical protein
MKTFKSSDNDGTLVISMQIAEPAQGTLVSIKDGEYWLAKGIVRPPFRHDVTGEQEEEQHVEEAAFGKKIGDVKDYKFFKIGEIGRRDFSLNMQTVMFASAYPAELIMQDNKKFETLTALDLLSKDAARKVKAGVSPALLVETMSPSDKYRKLAVNGIRSTTYASDMVHINTDLPLWRQTGSEADKMERAFKIATNGETMSCFMLLPKSSIELAYEAKCSEADLIGRIFLIHRDPALPDATSLFPSICLGVLDWANGCKNKYGVVLHPKDPFWKNAGGDFDGDDVAVVVPTTTLLPRGPISRPDYVMSAKAKSQETVRQQMIEACHDSVTGLLGPIILAATRLIERDYATNKTRAIMAAVAQGSVSAKKHVVDIDAIMSEAAYIFDMVRDGSSNGALPYISDFTNALRRASGTEAKEEAWAMFVKALPIWEETGTAIEVALCHRSRMLDQLFQDTNFFRMQARPELPKTLINSARSLCEPEVREAMQQIAEEYRGYAALAGEEHENEDDDVKESYIADIRDALRTCRAKFNLAAVTGQIGSIKTTPRDAQIALIAYAPARIAVKMASADIFEELGTKTKRAIINLIGHGWENGEIGVSELKPVPNCKADVAILAKLSETLYVQIISKAANSTRVCLSTTK